MVSNAAERAENARLIRDSAAFVAAPDRLKAMRAQRYTLPGFDRAEWSAFADLGWFGLRVPEAQGGAGFGVGEFCALAEQLGAGLTPAPVIQAIAIAPLTPDGWIDRIVAGQAIVLAAWQEDRGIQDQTLQTRLAGDRVTGEKRYVSMPDGADAFLVTAHDGLALVERDAPGLEVTTELLQDGGHYGALRFNDTPSVRLPGGFEAAREEIVLATAAYLLGMMRRAFAITADYLGTRQQFGRPVGAFQALQHRMVDLHIQIELTRASVGKAAAALDDGAPPDVRIAAVSRAKARASDAAMLVTRQAVQLHGGIGFTDDCDVGLYLRKAMVLANLYGSAAQHRARFIGIASQRAGA